MKRNTLIALAVFGVLVVLGLMSLTKERARGVNRIDLSTLSTQGVDHIVFTGKHAAELQKTGDAWTIKGKPADERAVQQLLEALPKIVSSSLVTKNKEKFADYEVDDEKGTRVKVLAGNTSLAELVIGKAASGGAHVRVGDEVYAVSGVYPRTFVKEASGWLEKKLFKAAVTDVEKVEVALAGQGAYQLVKKDNAWTVEGAQLPEGFRFDETAASRLVSALVGLRAKDILEEDPGAETTGLAQPADVLTFYTKDQTKAGQVTLGKTHEETREVYVAVEGRDDVVTVYESSVKSLRQAPTDFRDLRMVELDTNKVQKLTIVDGKATLALEKKGTEWSIAKSTEKVPSDFTLDPGAVNRRLSALRNARGLEILSDSPATAGLTPPRASVTATLEDGKTVTLALGHTTKRNDREIVFARGNIDDAVYAVNTHTRSNLVGMLDTFAKKEQPSGGPGALSSISPDALKNLPPDVRRQLEQQIREQQQQQKMLEQIQTKQP